MRRLGTVYLVSTENVSDELEYQSEPEWSPDSQLVAFGSAADRFAPSAVFVAPANGRGATIRIAGMRTGNVYSLSWRPVPSGT